MPIQFVQISKDFNGNPRYVCHFLNFMRPGEKADYKLALSRARKLGGKKYHTNGYRGGIVFQSYNLDNLSQMIESMMEDQA